MLHLHPMAGGGKRNDMPDTKRRSLPAPQTMEWSGLYGSGGWPSKKTDEAQHNHERKPAIKHLKRRSPVLPPELVPLVVVLSFIIAIVLSIYY